jgi:hypothetical protein
MIIRPVRTMIEPVPIQEFHCDGIGLIVVSNAIVQIVLYAGESVLESPDHCPVYVAKLRIRAPLCRLPLAAEQLTDCVARSAARRIASPSLMQ